MFSLDNKVALVAGGAGYLGSAVCRGLAHQGARIVVADIDEKRATQLAAELTRNAGDHICEAAVLDLRSENAISAAIDLAVSRFGSLDVVVNLSYSAHSAVMEEITPEGFSAALANNVTGSFLLARHAKAAMSDGGSIIFFSSMYGRVSPDPRMYDRAMPPNPIEYGVAKAGIEQMIRYLAVRWAPDNVRVNGIAPGAFPNPAVQQNTDFLKRLTAKIPMGRIGTPDEIVGAAVFLASEASRYVTGQTLVVDGGWTVW